MNHYALIEGTYTALATPFLSDGELDWQSFEAMVMHQIEGGVAGIVISGSTGEAPTLSVTEKLSMIRKCHALAKGRIKIMAGTGGNCTKQSTELSKLAADAGADSLLVVTPPYNKPNFSGLKLHYAAIASAVKIPVCLYHVPSRTAQILSPEQMATLTEIPGVTSIKEASGDLITFSKTKILSKATIVSGDDHIYLPTLSVGGNGIISVVSNVFPRALVELERAFRHGDLTRALSLHEALLPVISVLFIESNPCPLKSALAHLGLCLDIVRAPLAPVSIESRQAVIEALVIAKDKLRDLNALKKAAG